MDERRSIVFDNKIPLTWLMTSAVTAIGLLLTVLWNVAGQSNKLDQLVKQTDNIERRTAERDIKLEALIRDNYIMGVRIEALEKKNDK